MKSMTDEEILAKAKAGSSEATDYLLNKYKEKVKGIAKTLYLMGGDRDDLIQEGMIGLFRAIHDYTCEGGASFATFADLCIRRQMYKAVESYGRQKNMPLNEYVSLYTPVKTNDETEEVRLIDTMSAGIDMGPEELLIDEENAKRFEERLRASFSGLENEVFELYIAGYGNNAAMAAKLNITEKSVDNALSRIKAKARKCMEE